MNNWIEISEDRLAANFHALEASAGPATEVLAVVKADGYGHGATRCAPILARAGARWLGVTNAAEGVRVRTALAAAGSPSPDIMVMCGFLPGDAVALASASLTPVLWTPLHATWLAGAATPPVHIEIDTGMGRQGVLPGAPLDELLDALAAHAIPVGGILTHFCSSEEAASALTQIQERRFEAAVAQLTARGIRPAWVHAGNSSTLDNPAQPTPWLASLAASAGARAMVRSGLALYGFCLPIDGPAAPHVRPALRPVLTWHAHILSVRDLAPGDTVGYNATFTATHSMRVALLPVGYADGLRRELSGRADGSGGWAVIHGQRAPILGRISMNLTVVDVTSIPSAAPNDTATLLGEGISAEDHARLARTIPYEILCGIHPCG